MHIFNIILENKKNINNYTSTLPEIIIIKLLLLVIYKLFYSLKRNNFCVEL